MMPGQFDVLLGCCNRLGITVAGEIVREQGYACTDWLLASEKLTGQHSESHR